MVRDNFTHREQLPKINFEGHIGKCGIPLGGDSFSDTYSRH